jgi:hypothetical protein
MSNNINVWIDSQSGIIYNGDEEMVKFLRSQGDKEYNDVSDEFILQEAYLQHWIDIVE